MSDQNNTNNGELAGQSGSFSVVHGSAGLVFRLRALADDDRYAWNDWSEDILRQAADEIEKRTVGHKKAHLDDSVTVGQLMRWINAEAVNAGRNGDHDDLGALARIGERVEAAHALYRASLPNAPGQERALPNGESKL